MPSISPRFPLYGNLNRNHRILPKSMIMFFAFFHIVLGLDHGFYRLLPRYWRPLAKLISLAATCHILYLFIHTVFKERRSASASIIANIVLFSFFVLFLMFSKYSIYDFMVDTHSMDITARYKEEQLYFILKSLFFIFAFGIFRIGMCQYACSITLGPCTGDGELPYCYHFISYLSVDSTPVITASVNFQIFLQVKHFKELLSSKILDGKNAIHYYNEIFNNLDKIKPVYNKLLLGYIVFMTPYLLSLMFFSFTRLVPTITKYYFIPTAYVIFTAIGITITSVVVEMTNAEIREIKINIHRRLVMCSDRKKYFEIKGLLDFIEAHDLNHEIWGMVPIDMKLPIGVLSLCMTCLFYMLQFSVAT